MRATGIALLFAMAIAALLLVWRSAACPEREVVLEALAREGGLPSVADRGRWIRVGDWAFLPHRSVHAVDAGARLVIYREDCFLAARPVTTVARLRLWVRDRIDPDPHPLWVVGWEAPD
ncbi:MAG: hypothetical protein ACYSX0_11545 [Planctomycetota bacterium]|jgi:hypothetical protein